MKKFFEEFKKFITRGNVMDMAVGVIVGGAFTTIVTSLTNNILRPFINFILWLIMGGQAETPIYTMLHPVYNEGALDLASSIYIDWGAFISAIINFLLIALVLFLIIKVINTVNEAGLRAQKGLKTQKEAVKKYKTEGLTKKEAVKKYEAELKAQEEAEKAKAEADSQKAMEEEAAKAMANTKLLEEIRDLLKNK